MNERDLELSAGAGQRKAAMHTELLGELERVRAERQLQRRVGGSAALVILVASLIWIAWRPGASNMTRLASSTPAPIFEVVRTDAALTAPWIVRTDASALAEATQAIESTIVIERLSDQELVTRLAALGTHTGIARSGERVWLTEDIFARR